MRRGAVYGLEILRRYMQNKRGKKTALLCRSAKTFPLLKGGYDIKKGCWEDCSNIPVIHFNDGVFNKSEELTYLNDYFRRMK